MAGAVQLSDVGFFWEAPGMPSFPKVPWAVTANLMIKNTGIRSVMLMTYMLQACTPSKYMLCMQSLVRTA